MKTWFVKYVVFLFLTFLQKKVFDYWIEKCGKKSITSKKLFNFILIQLDDVKCEQWFAALSSKGSKNKIFSFYLNVRNGVALTKRSSLK